MVLAYVKIFTSTPQMFANLVTLLVHASNVFRLQCVLSAITIKGMKKHHHKQTNLVYAEVTFQRSTKNAFCVLSLDA